jgi:hypothetical protein
VRQAFFLMETRTAGGESDRGSGFLPEHGEEEGELIAGAVLGAGAGARLALLVGMPLLETTKSETCVKASFHEFLQAAMKGDGVLAFFLAWVHDDGDTQRTGVGIQAAILDFPFFIETPGGLAGNAKAGVIQRPKKAPAGSKNGSRGDGRCGQVLDVLQAENGGSGVKRAESVESSGITHEKTTTWTRISFGLVDQRGCGIDAGSPRTFCGDSTGEDALTAAEVEVGFVFEGIQEFKRAGDDDLLIEV